MNVTTLKKIAYLYVSIPLFIFCLCWLNLASSIVFTALLSCGICLVWCSLNDEKPQCIGHKIILAAAIIAFIWCFCSGIGGYFYQAGEYADAQDFSARNAVLRDLINYDWPINYGTNNRTMNYYFGFWLPPALLTKAFRPFFNAEQLFTLGLNLQMIYAWIGVTLFLLLIITYIKPQNKKQVALCLLLPVLFSGMDVIPVYTNINSLHQHIDGWNKLQYSSNTTQLFWVFNQTIITWVCFLLFLNEKTFKNYGLIFVSCLFCGPLPAVGVGTFMLAYIFRALNYRFSLFALKSNCQLLFSRQNLVMIPFLLLLWTFFNANNIAQSEFHWRHTSIQKYLGFCLTEFLLYAVCIWHTFKKDIIFYFTVTSLLLICCFQIGDYPDFCMRVSIPALLMLMLYLIHYLIGININNIPPCTVMLIIGLILGAFTPAIEFSNGINRLLQTGKITHRCDNFITFADKDITTYPFYNYILDNPETKPFYQYFGASNVK